MLTYERLKEVLRYEPDTGLFYWKVSTAQRVKVGQKAGGMDKYGYIVIVIDKVPYKAHRLAWLYVYGKWPVGDIDHIHGVRYDNRISQIRDVSRSANLYNQHRAKKNSLAGVLGVSKSGSSFVARIGIGGKCKYLGTYKTADEAHSAYLEAREKLLTPEKPEASTLTEEFVVV